MQDDKPTDPHANPDTQILRDISNDTTVAPLTHNESEPIEKPQLGPVVIGGKKSHKKLWMMIALLLLICGVAYAAYNLNQEKQAVVPPIKSIAKESNVAETAVKTEGLVLDTTKNYGNKYADGLLPVGDNKYSTSAAAVGSVYACAQYAQNFGQDRGGAGTRGPWFTNNNTQYNINKKSHVSGNVMWTSSFSNSLSGTTRTIATNDLPSHSTGVYPISSSDPAYAYDRNPSTISAQTLNYALAATPTYGVPNCMGGDAGVMLTGVVINNGFDANGRDAGAWEVQDSCGGHPQNRGLYHYHTYSSCIKDRSVHDVIGYALDGFPITGPTVAPNNILTTTDLDECHGITSSYTVDGKTVTGYHYVMTEDFPYSVSCFRAQPTQPPR